MSGGAWARLWLNAPKDSPKGAPTRLEAAGLRGPHAAIVAVMGHHCGKHGDDVVEASVALVARWALQHRRHTRRLLRELELAGVVAGETRQLKGRNQASWWYLIAPADLVDNESMGVHSPPGGGSQPPSVGAHSPQGEGSQPPLQVFTGVDLSSSINPPTPHAVPDLADLWTMPSKQAGQKPNSRAMGTNPRAVAAATAAGVLQAHEAIWKRYLPSDCPDRTPGGPLLCGRCKSKAKLEADAASQRSLDEAVGDESW